MTEQQIIDNELALRDRIIGLVKNEDGTKTISPELLNINMFIEAGAGAGKTYTIVQRIMNQLSIGKKPGEIVVITFTNKAAEELRGRIAKNLNKIVAKTEDENTRETLRNALNHLDDMNISTIHSFCFKLLKERCFDIALPMDMGLLDNETTEETKQDLFEEWLSTLSKADWDKLVALDPNNKNRRQLKADIYDIYEKTCTAPAEKKIHIEPDIQTDLNDLAKQVVDGLEPVFTAMINNMVTGANTNSWGDVFALNAKTKPQFLGSKFVNDDGIIDELAKPNPDYISILKNFVKNGDSSEDKDAKTGKRNKEKVGFVHFIAATNSGKLKGKNDYDLDLYADVQDYISSPAVSETIDIIYNDGIRKYRNEVASLAQKAREYYRLKKTINTLTNDELLELTRDMVLGSDDANEYFANKYTCYYVDEFQDTDRVQESFIWKLASVVGDTTKLRPGALFVVGDPKQSIYRFRGAEPQVYLDVQKRMEQMPDEMAEVHKLQINFRSNGLVIKWVNDKFSSNKGFAPIMNDPTGRNQYVYQQMLHVKGIDPAAMSKLKPQEYGVAIDETDATHLLAGMYKYEKPDINTEEDVCLEETDPKQLLTDLILNLVDNEKYHITRYDEDNNPYEDKIHFEDFMILCHGKGRMNGYLEYLSLRGIPIQIAGDTNPADILEMNAFVRIYNYTANQKDQKARIAALEAIRELGISEKEEEIEKYGLALLNKLYDSGRKLSAYGLAEHILANLSAVLRQTRQIPALEMQSIQTKIRQMIETVCRDNYGTPKDIAEKFVDYLNEKVEHELSLDPNTKAVQFMNIHKSKGLEGNIVVLVDRRAKDSLDISSLWHDDANTGESEYYAKAKQYRKYRKQEKEELLAERRRLEYVTVTRAGQVFIFMDFEGGDTTLFNGTSDVSEYGLNELPSIACVVNETDPHDIPVGSGNSTYSIANEIETLNKKVNCIAEEALIPDCQRISPSHFEAGTSQTKNAAIAKSKNEEGRCDEDEISSTLIRPTGNILGTTLHRSLQLMVERYDAILKLNSDMQTRIINACADQAINEELTQIEDNAKVYRDFLYAVLKAYFEWLKKEGILSDVKIHTEFPFSYYEKANLGDETQLSHANKHLSDSNKLKVAPVWMNGSADLLLVKPGEWIRIIDYKSDNDYYVPEEDFDVSMSEKYIGQLDNYRYAMSKLYPDILAEKITMSIISFSQKDENRKLLPGNEIRVRCTQI